MSERQNRDKIRPHLRPRSAGKERGERFPTAKASILARLGKASSGRMTGGARRGQSRGSIDTRIDGASARRVVVKLSYQRLNDYGKKAARAHLRYIAREGRDLYDGQGVVDLERETSRKAAAAEEILFR